MVTASKKSTHLQYKNEKTPVTVGLMVKKAEKVVYAHDNTNPLTFVILGLNVSMWLQNYMGGIKVNLATLSIIWWHWNILLQIMKGDTEYAVWFPSGTSFEFCKKRAETQQAMFIIPQNMDIIMVLRAGIDHFLTLHNAKMLQSGNYVEYLHFIVSDIMTL